MLDYSWGLEFWLGELGIRLLVRVWLGSMFVQIEGYSKSLIGENRGWQQGWATWCQGWGELGFGQIQVGVSVGENYSQDLGCWCGLVWIRVGCSMLVIGLCIGCSGLGQN